MFLNFYRSKSFGLDISDRSIEALQLEKKLGKFYLGSYARVELEEGIVEDGRILKKEKLKEKIKELLENAKPRKIGSKQVILSLPESKTFLNIFQVSRDLRDEALKKTVSETAVKTIPLEQEKAYWDFIEVSDREKLDPETIYLKSILYVSAPKDIVDEYIALLESLNLKVKAIDMESASLARTFEKNRGEEGTLLVDIGARTTVITVLDEGSIRFSAIVQVAGNHFTKAISEKLKVSLKEAETLKKKCGLNPKKEEGKVMLVLQNTLQEILEEIKKTISFYEEKTKRSIKRILLCGGSSFLPKLSSYFSSNIGIETEIPDPWEGIEVEKVLKIEEMKKLIETELHPVFFSNVIGLAKRGLEENPETAGINLMPSGKEPKKTLTRGKKQKNNKLFLYASAFALSGIVFLGWLIFSKKILSLLSPRKIPAEVTTEEEKEQILEEETLQDQSQEEEEVVEIPEITIAIEDTETGWLRVREGPGLGFSEVARVYPGESYPLLEEASGWYKIRLKEGQEGWVSADYASK